MCLRVLVVECVRTVLRMVVAVIFAEGGRAVSHYSGNVPHWRMISEIGVLGCDSGRAILRESYSDRKYLPTDALDVFGNQSSPI